MFIKKNLWHMMDCIFNNMSSMGKFVVMDKSDFGVTSIVTDDSVTLCKAGKVLRQEIVKWDSSVQMSENDKKNTKAQAREKTKETMVFLNRLFGDLKFANGVLIPRARLAHNHRNITKNSAVMWGSKFYDAVDLWSLASAKSVINVFFHGDGIVLMDEDSVTVLFNKKGDIDKLNVVDVNNIIVQEDHVDLKKNYTIDLIWE